MLVKKEKAEKQLKNIFGTIEKQDFRTFIIEDPYKKTKEEQQ